MQLILFSSGGLCANISVVSWCWNVFPTLVCSLDMLVHSFLEQQRNLYLVSLPQTITGIQIKGQCLESLKQRLEVFLFRAHLKIDCEQNEQNPEQWTSFRILPLLHPVEPHQEKKTFKNFWACQPKIFSLAIFNMCESCVLVGCQCGAQILCFLSRPRHREREREGVMRRRLQGNPVMSGYLGGRGYI